MQDFKTIRLARFVMLALLGMTIIVIGCQSSGDFPGLAAEMNGRLSPPKVEVTLTSSDTQVSAASPVTLTVNATNRGISRAPIGRGSSSCWTGAFIRSGLEELWVASDRACTGDIVEYSLKPDESKVESWSWSGWVLVNGEAKLLPPGQYLLVGYAGSQRDTVGFEIELVSD